MQGILQKLSLKKTQIEQEFSKLYQQREKLDRQRTTLSKLHRELKAQNEATAHKNREVLEIENYYKKELQRLTTEKSEFDNNKNRLFEYFRKIRNEIEKKEAHIKTVLEETQKKRHLVETEAVKLHLQKQSIISKGQELKEIKERVSRDISHTNKQREELNSLLHQNKLLQKNLAEREREINNKDSLLTQKIQTAKQKLSEKEARILKLLEKMRAVEQQYQAEITRLKTRNADLEKNDNKHLFPPLFKINGNDMNYPYPYPWFYPQQKQEDSSNQIRHLFEQQLQFMQQRYENELTELRRQRALLEKKLDQIQLESQLSAKKNDFEKVEQMMQKLLEKTEQKLSAFDQKINALAEQINTQKAEHADSEKQQLLLRIEQLEKQNLAQAVQTPQPVQPVVQAPAVVPQVIQPQVVQSQPAFLATQQSISKQQQIAQLNAEINSIKKLIAQKAAK